MMISTKKKKIYETLHEPPSTKNQRIMKRKREKIKIHSLITFCVPMEKNTKGNKVAFMIQFFSLSTLLIVDEHTGRDRMSELETQLIYKESSSSSTE